MSKNNGLLAATLVMASSVATAVDIEAVIGAGLEHTDNAFKESANQRSELEQYLTADFQLDYTGTSLTANLDYSSSFVSYDKDTEEDETVVVGNGFVEYEQIEQQLYWTLENNRSNVIKDKSLVDVQGNREDKSTTTIGSRFIARPSRADSISTGLKYSEISFEDSTLQDSDRATLSINWMRLLTKIDTLRLSGSYQDVNFDNNANEYEVYLLTIGYQVALSKLSYSVDVGANQAKRDQSDVDGGYFKLLANYNHGGSEFSLVALQELTDTARQDDEQGLDVFSDFDSISTEVDIFEITNLEVEYKNSLVCRSCEVRASFRYEAEDYETLANDSEELSFETDFNYSLTRLLSLNVSVGYREFSFTGGNPREDYDLMAYDLGLSQQLGQSISLSYFLGYEDRPSSGASKGYEEFRGGIGVKYRFD